MERLTISKCPCGSCNQYFIDQAGIEGRWSKEDAEFIRDTVNAALDGKSTNPIVEDFKKDHPALGGWRNS